MPRKPRNEEQAHNEAVLDQRDELIAERKTAEAAQADALGLGVPAAPEPVSATEFIDEFDRRGWGAGESHPTIRRIIYGPDDLVDNSPAFHDMLKTYGREGLANRYYELILAKGAEAMPDLFMRKKMSYAILKTSRQAMAEAFRNRVLRIPERSVEIDASDTPDDEVMGTRIFDELVRKYEEPGYRYGFFSKTAMDMGVAGWRGYEPVIDRQTGKPVQAGTQMMGRLPLAVWERRQVALQAEAARHLREVGEQQRQKAEALIAKAGRELDVRTDGLAPLRIDEEFTPNYGETLEETGGSRRVGVTVKLERGE